MDWALPLYTAWGIRVRVHLIFIVMIIAQLIWSIRQDQLGPGYVATAMAALFVLVLLHEYGHCFACRRVGGEADQILMWPLGGLAYCRPPHDWKADLITTLGGPAVNVVLFPVFGGALLAVGAGWQSVIFNPFDPGGVLGGVLLRSGLQPYWLVALWWLHFVNLLLLAFNMLLPMFPMDCGRVVQAVLWAKMGHRRSLEIATTIGMAAAGVLAVVSLTVDQTHLLGIAIFGGVVCYMEKRRLKFSGDEGGIPGYDFSKGYGGMLGSDEDDEPAGPSRAEAKRHEREQAEAVEIDRILAKIGDGGMDSLSRKERLLLEKATKKKQGG